MNDTLVLYWRFEDGEAKPNPSSQWGMNPLPRGWYCWVYPESNCEFETWMEENCPTADCVRRFNSGDPMITVYIKDDKEAELFESKWKSNFLE